MSIKEQRSDGHGSLKDIQVLINNKVQLIDNRIKIAFPALSNHVIKWLSPLSKDNYSEYQDTDFIKKIELDEKEIKLNQFWPLRGPQWDALAITNEKSILLFEAKANIPEIVTPACSASQKSKVLIDKSLKQTKEYLGINNDIDWSGKFYQYTNRLTHLYFLRILCKKPAYLIFIYFINDASVNGPSSETEWKAALQVMYSYLGIGRHKLSKYIANIFIDVNDLM